LEFHIGLQISFFDEAFDDFHIQVIPAGKT